MTILNESNIGVSKHLIASGGELSGEYIHNLECPSYGKRKAFNCNCKNKCGVTTDIDAKNIIPELFQEFQTKHPPTKSNPTATAVAYPKSRGLNPDKIEIEQEKITVDGKDYPSVGFKIGRASCRERV